VTDLLAAIFVAFNYEKPHNNNICFMNQKYILCHFCKYLANMGKLFLFKAKLGWLQRC